MDSSKIGSSGTSQRRRLTKKPPSAHHHLSSHSHHIPHLDGRVDARSLGSKRSSTSLKRAPSASLGTNRTTSTSANASFSTDSSSSPRFHAAPSPAFPASSINRSHTTPIFPISESTAPSALPHSHSHPVHGRSDAQHSRPGPPDARQPLSSKTSDELIGAPFDGTAILNRIEATKSPVQTEHSTTTPIRISDRTSSGDNSSQTPPRSAQPQSSPHHATPRTRTMGHSPPPLRQSASFPATDLPILSEKTKTDAAAAPAKRYSDESKESKIPSVLRKKSGFSGFMNSLVGSPRKPLISAPENPVHVTHVGYDSSTGQFTVCCLACLLASALGQSC